MTFYDLFMREMLIEWVEFTGLDILKANFHSNYSCWKESDTDCDEGKNV